MALDPLYLASGGAQLEVNKQLLERDRLNAESANQADMMNLRYMQEARAQQEHDLSMRIKQEAERKQKMEERLIGSVMNANIPGKLQTKKEDADEDLINKYNTLGVKLAGIDPKASNEYFKLAVDTRTKLMESKKDAIALQQANINEAGRVAHGVNNQVTLDNAVKQLAELGVLVPQEARNWEDPNAKEWFKTTAMQSKTVQEELKARLAEDALKLKREEFTHKKEVDEAKAAERKAKEAKTRERIVSSAANKIPFSLKEDDVKNYRKLMEENDNFDAADKKTQQLAIDHIPMLASQIMREERTTDMAYAMEKARTQILNAFTPDGTYSYADVKSTPVEALYGATTTPATNKTVVKTFRNKSTGQIKYVYSDGSEEIK